jgi:hypothetical protein
MYIFSNNLKTKYKFKAIFSSKLRNKINRYGVCPNCKIPNRFPSRCNKCDSSIGSENIFSKKLKIEMDEYIILKLKYKFKVIFSKSLRQQIRTRGVCPHCKRPNTGFAWCDKCDPGRFLKEGKTSGNPEIDKIIHEAQLKTSTFGDSFYNIEWIPYDRLQDVKPIGKGGFANIFSATWLDGKPNRLSKRKKLPVKFTVALKELITSNIQAFINEVNFLKIIKFHL